MQRTVALEFIIFLPRARTMSVQCLVGAGMLGAVLSVRPLGIMLPLRIRVRLRRLMGRLRLLLRLLLLLLLLRLRVRLRLVVVLVCRSVGLGLAPGGCGGGVVGSDLDLVCNGDVDCRV